MLTDVEIYITPVTIKICANNWDLVYFYTDLGDGCRRVSRRCMGHNNEKKTLEKGKS